MHSSKKILIIGLAAYKVEDKSGIDPESKDRQQLYTVALNWLYKIMPPNCKIILSDVTVPDRSFLCANLQKELENEKVKDVVFVNNNSQGSKNKGAGEYVMCKAVVQKHEDYICSFDWVIYYTSRHIMSFPLVFEYIEEYNDFDAIVGNPSYFFSNNEVIPSAQGNYTDMIFAMKPPEFIQYVNMMDPEYLIKRHMNSEAFLYNFIHENQVKFKEVEHWGVFRYDSLRMEIV